MTNELKKNITIINANIEKIRHDFCVKKIAIFGSIATGKHTKKSDIDILIELSRPIGFFKFIELENYLSRLLNRKVDLVTKKALKPVIKTTILKEAIYVR